jgi:hypothetical protein
MRIHNTHFGGARALGGERGRARRFRAKTGPVRCAVLRFSSGSKDEDRFETF